ncbi:MAG TPA: CoA transferase [Acidimicrobiales bacterium]|nr:CoA transferase [Acidimicrobiales bacterium]
MPPRRAALAGLRVCDFTGQLAGAGATRFLAAMGAQVIRVEDPVRRGGWDILRGAPPFVDERRGIELGGAFNNHNVEKLGVTVNLRTEAGRRLARRLLAVSDVLTENFAAGVMDRLGLSYDEVRAVRPDIVYVANSGFGATGPYAPFKTWGPIVQACCGLTFESGLRDLPTAGWGFSYMDHHGASFMAIAVLAALVHRNRTGEGQYVDMSCTDAGATLTGPELLDFTVNGRPLRRPGMPDSNHSTSPAMAPHNIYPAAGDDAWVAIACRDDADWERLAGAVGEGWARQPRFATLAGRMGAEDDLDRAVAGWTAGRDRFAVAGLLQQAGVPAAAVTRPEDRIEHDPATAAWGLWPVVEHPEMGRVRVDGIPVHLSATDWRIERAAPLLGQHNREVFCGILGLDEGELAALRAEGVV